MLLRVLPPNWAGRGWILERTTQLSPDFKPPRNRSDQVSLEGIGYHLPVLLQNPVDSLRICAYNYGPIQQSPLGNKGRG